MKRKGADGFTALYYKKFAPIFAPQLVLFFNALRQGGSVEVDSNRQFISLVLKPHNDPCEVTNYRPISLINCDLKLLAKMYASRLNTFIAHYRHTDQAGFDPDRPASDQIRRGIDLISVLHMSWDQGSTRRGMLLSLGL